MGSTDPDTGQRHRQFFPNIGGYPVLIGLGTGQVNFQPPRSLGGGNTAAYNDMTSLLTSRRLAQLDERHHAFKFGGEIRRGHSLGYDAGIAITSIPRALGGDAPLGRDTDRRDQQTNMPGLAGTTTTGNNSECGIC